MYADFVLIPDDAPGMLGRLGAAAGAAGVNLEGISAFTGEGRGVVHVLVRATALDRCISALAEAGMDVRTARHVVVVDIDDRPGWLGEVGAALAEAEVNVAQIYLATRNRMVLACDDLDAARRALGIAESGDAA